MLEIFSLVNSKRLWQECSDATLIEADSLEQKPGERVAISQAFCDVGQCLLAELSFPNWCVHLGVTLSVGVKADHGFRIEDRVGALTEIDTDIGWSRLHDPEAHGVPELPELEFRR